MRLRTSDVSETRKGREPIGRSKARTAGRRHGRLGAAVEVVAGTPGLGLYLEATMSDWSSTAWLNSITARDSDEQDAREDVRDPMYGPTCV